jgi:hypothetical protein
MATLSSTTAVNAATIAVLGLRATSARTPPLTRSVVRRT